MSEKNCWDPRSINGKGEDTGHKCCKSAKDDFGGCCKKAANNEKPATEAPKKGCGCHGGCHPKP